jgi:aromatic-L-amino-acid decarboxylase
MSQDVPDPELRAALHRVADMIADYLQDVGQYKVLPSVRPGEVDAMLSSSPPLEGESLNAILDDYARIIEPNITHWNHPGFLGYFSITGSGPGIVGEALSAALNVNAMLWRTSPAATELEERVCDWLRQMLGLPEDYRGHINDTASISTMLALAAARHSQSDLRIRDLGLAGRPDLPELVVYTSDQAHSSCDKAAMTLGLGLEHVRRIESDRDFRMSFESLVEAIDNDRRAGRRPIAVVATAGTTSTTSVDPIDRIAELCRQEGIWLHVDAAYAGSAAICPELREEFAGWEQADSIVFNPHKWLFTPIDCSVLMMRDVDVLRSAFSLVPEYLKTDEEGVTNLMDLGVQLGRRFRALKLWMVIRAFGVEGLQARIREHCRMATNLASTIESDPDFEVVAPVPFSVVCFRWRAGDSPEEQDALNEMLLNEINAQGPILLSSTSLEGRFTLHLAIGNLKTTELHLQEAWRLIRSAADRLSAAQQS